MAQVIEVRFANPATGEVLHDAFTEANSHRHAIDLAMHSFSGGVGVIKRIEKQDEGEFLPRGANYCWRYRYLCIVADDEIDREMVALLFATYKEKVQ